MPTPRELCNPGKHDYEVQSLTLTSPDGGIKKQRVFRVCRRCSDCLAAADWWQLHDGKWVYQKMTWVRE